MVFFKANYRQEISSQAVNWVTNLEDMHKTILCAKFCQPVFFLTSLSNDWWNGWKCRMRQNVIYKKYYNSANFWATELKFCRVTKNYYITSVMPIFAIWLVDLTFRFFTGSIYDGYWKDLLEIFIVPYRITQKLLGNNLSII